jgi:hypothetical protein
MCMMCLPLFRKSFKKFDALFRLSQGLNLLAGADHDLDELDDLQLPAALRAAMRLGPPGDGRRIVHPINAAVDHQGAVGAVRATRGPLGFEPAQALFHAHGPSLPQDKNSLKNISN